MSTRNVWKPLQKNRYPCNVNDTLIIKLLCWNRWIMIMNNGVRNTAVINKDLNNSNPNLDANRNPNQPWNSISVEICLWHSSNSLQSLRLRRRGRLYICTWLMSTLLLTVYVQSGDNLMWVAISCLDRQATYELSACKWVNRKCAQQNTIRHGFIVLRQYTDATMHDAPYWWHTPKKRNTSKLWWNERRL